MMTVEPPEFIPGLRLCEIFFSEAVRPILDRHFPGLSYSAARLDYGSDVLGFDTPLSRDHGWGPRVTLFLAQKDCENYREPISEVMSNELPVEIRGYPTNFEEPFSGDSIMQAVEHGPVRHWVAVDTIPSFFKRYLGVDPGESIREVDWLVMPQQHLRTIRSGEIFHDGLNQLVPCRERLHWYPEDIWRYLLANQWRRIDQEEPFMARCGDVGDELGSQVVASRQVVEIMHLCFLMERQYAPYYKWFGTAFTRLDCAPVLTPILLQIFSSQDWLARENALSKAYLVLMEMHNDLGVTSPIEPRVAPFFKRPYQVPHAARFVDALHDSIRSEVVRGFPRNIGGLTQLVNSTDVLSNPEWGRKWMVIFE